MVTKLLNRGWLLVWLRYSMGQGHWRSRLSLVACSVYFSLQQLSNVNLGLPRYVCDI